MLFRSASAASSSSSSSHGDAPPRRHSDGDARDEPTPAPAAPAPAMTLDEAVAVITASAAANAAAGGGGGGGGGDFGGSGGGARRVRLRTMPGVDPDWILKTQQTSIPHPCCCFLACTALKLPSVFKGCATAFCCGVLGCDARCGDWTSCGAGFCCGVLGAGFGCANGTCYCGPTVLCASLVCSAGKVRDTAAGSGSGSGRHIQSLTEAFASALGNRYRHSLKGPWYVRSHKPNRIEL